MGPLIWDLKMKNCGHWKIYGVKQREPTSIGPIRFLYKSGMLFIELPRRRRLSIWKPKMGINKFGSESVTYEMCWCNKEVGANRKLRS